MIWFVLAVVLTVITIPLARQLRFERTIESLYAVDDPAFQNYADSKRLFGGDEYILVAWEDPDLFTDGDAPQLTPAARTRILALTEKLHRIPKVNPEQTQHLVLALEGPGDLISAVQLILNRQGATIREKILNLMEGLLLGEDHRVTAVLIKLDPEGALSPAEFDRRAGRVFRDKNDTLLGLGAVAAFRTATANAEFIPREETIAAIRAVAEAHNPPAAVVGEPAQISDMFRYAEKDGELLFRVSLGVLAVVMLLLFRSLRWVLLPLAVVGASILWTQAALVLSGLELSMVSSMLNSLVTIIGVATTMHIAVHYRSQRSRHDPEEAVAQTLADLLPAIFWTCATTATGFLALLSSRITPVRSFGLMMGIGTAMVFLATVVIVPAGILWIRRGTDPKATFGEGSLLKSLETAEGVATRHPLATLLVFTALTLFSFSGLFRLRVETDFSKNFRAGSPIVKSLDFVETRLGGAGLWEVNFPAPRRDSFDEETPLTVGYLNRVQALRDDLAAIRYPNEPDSRPLTKIVAVTDGLDVMPSKIPVFGEISLPRKLVYMEMFQPQYMDGLYNAEAGRMRIVLRSQERQPSEKKSWLITEVDRVVRQHFPGGGAWSRPRTITPERDRLGELAQGVGVSGANAIQEPMLTDHQTAPGTTTGLFVLLTHLIESLLQDQWVSLSLAAAGIALAMALAFRSVVWGLLSLLPNLFPIVIVIGVMGWLDYPINIATAMIASVSMGLTVDSSIHYLAAFRRSRAAGESVRESLRQTQRDVGRALIFANLALVAGFCVLTLSEFVPLIYFGVLVSVAMLGGVVGNLFLLPLLIRLVYRADYRAEATSP